MAIIQLGTTVVGIRGTIGGVTYSANKSGAHAKMWRKGINPKTALQQTTRSITTLLNTEWAALSAVNRAAWNAYNAGAHEVVYNSLGQVINLSGQQWYQKLNHRMQQVGLASVATAPAGYIPVGSTPITIVGTSAPLVTIDIPLTSPAGTNKLVVFGQVKKGSFVAAPTAGYKYVTYVAHAAAAPVDITAAWIAIFGNPVIGTTLCIMVAWQQVANGQRYPSAVASLGVVT